MSNYYAPARHPTTGVIEVALWLDDHFVKHKYGVRFGDGTICTAQEAHTGHAYLRPHCCGGGVVVRIDEEWGRAAMGCFTCPKCGRANWAQGGSVGWVHPADPACRDAVHVLLWWPE